MRKDVSEALMAQGLTVLRYGGSMVNCPEYRWKQMIGPRDRRQPYKGTWYPYSTNGWGIIDFISFCEAAGFLGIPDLNMDETPQDMADFVEYINGPADSEWGRRRVADGHPAPFGLKYIQLGNEEAVNDVYWEKFKPLVEAIWSRDPNIIPIVGDFAYGDLKDEVCGVRGAEAAQRRSTYPRAPLCSRQVGTVADMTGEGCSARVVRWDGCHRLQLMVGDVYVRIYNEQPSFLLESFEQFAVALLTYLRRTAEILYKNMTPEVRSRGVPSLQRMDLSPPPSRARHSPGASLSAARCWRPSTCHRRSRRLSPGRSCWTGHCRRCRHWRTCSRSSPRPRRRRSTGTR